MRTMVSVLIICLVIGSLRGYSQEYTNDKELGIIKDFLDAAFNKNHNKQLTLMHENIVDYHPTVLEEPSIGKDAVVNDWKNLMTMTDSVFYKNPSFGKVNMKSGSLKGTWVLCVGELHAFFKGNDKVNITQMVGLYRLKNDQIIEVRNYGNLLDMYMQLGYALQPPKQN